MTIDQYKVLIEARPVPTPAQWAAARRLAQRECPDLVAMLFGGAS